MDKKKMLSESHRSEDRYTQIEDEIESEGETVERMGKKKIMVWAPSIKLIVSILSYFPKNQLTDNFIVWFS